MLRRHRSASIAAAAPPVWNEAEPTVPRYAPSAAVEVAAVELVLRRAIELAAAEAGPGSEPESVPVSVLHQVAEELSVPATALTAALAEYRAALGGPLPSSLTGSPTLADRLFGPGQVATVHHSELPAEVTVDHLRRWLARRHRLRVRQPSPEVIVAVRRRGVVPEMGRRIRAANGSAGLSGMREVRGAVVEAGTGISSLCLVADVRDQRTQSVMMGTAVAVGAGAVVAVVAAFTAPVALAGLPVAVGTGWMVTRFSHRHRLQRVQEEVDLTAEQAATGTLPPTLISEVADRLDEHIARRLTTRTSSGRAASRPTR